MATKLVEDLDLPLWLQPWKPIEEQGRERAPGGAALRGSLPTEKDGRLLAWIPDF